MTIAGTGLFAVPLGQAFGEVVPESGDVMMTAPPPGVPDNGTISGGGLTLEGSSLGAWFRSNVAHQSGKYYFEFTLDTVMDNCGVGVGTVDQYEGEVGPWLGDSTDAIAVWFNEAAAWDGYANFNEDEVGSIGDPAVSDTICAAIDLDNDKVWFRVNGGDWNDTPTDDPATGTGGFDISTRDPGQWLVWAEIDADADQITFNFGAAAYAHTPPVGFGDWDGSEATALELSADAELTLTDSNLTAENTNSINHAAGARSTVSHTAGKYYYEFTRTTALDTGVGIGTADAVVSGIEDIWLGLTQIGMGLWVGDWPDADVYFGEASIPTVGPCIDGDVLCTAVDLDNDRIWFRVNGGDWNNSPAADPATNTGGIDISAIPAGDRYVWVDAEEPGDTVTFNFGRTAYAHTPPTGFGDW
jgi:hypothetical protein